jgi:hypothetical protein
MNYLTSACADNPRLLRDVVPAVVRFPGLISAFENIFRRWLLIWQGTGSPDPEQRHIFPVPVGVPRLSGSTFTTGAGEETCVESTARGSFYLLLVLIGAA